MRLTRSESNPPVGGKTMLALSTFTTIPIPIHITPSRAILIQVMLSSFQTMTSSQEASTTLLSTSPYLTHPMTPYLLTQKITIFYLRNKTRHDFRYELRYDEDDEDG